MRTTALEEVMKLLYFHNSAGRQAVSRSRATLLAAGGVANGGAS